MADYPDLKSIQEKALKVINGESQEEDFSLMCSPNFLDECLRNLCKLEPDGDLRTNGWDYDFWQDYKSENGKKFTLSGGGWYGYLMFRDGEDK